jgi:hypothetical protein
MIPWSVMRERLPERNQPPTGGKIESRTGVGSPLAVHLLALSNEIATLDESVQGSVSRSTLELLGIALSGQQPSATFDASATMLRRAQDFILQHLHDDDLNPTRIAEANHISLRYLHMLFQRSDMTVSGWVLDSRTVQTQGGLLAFRVPPKPERLGLVGRIGVEECLVDVGAGRKAVHLSCFGASKHPRVAADFARKIRRKFRKRKRLDEPRAAHRKSCVHLTVAQRQGLAHRRGPDLAKFVDRHVRADVVRQLGRVVRSRTRRNIVHSSTLVPLGVS